MKSSYANRGLKLLMFFAITFFVTSTCFSAGNVDWQQKVIIVTGSGGAMPGSLSLGQANSTARRAAIVDAYRNLAEEVNGLTVEGNTTVQNSVIANDVVKTKVQASIRGAHIIKEWEENGMRMVSMELNLFGDGSITDAVLDKTQPTQTVPLPTEKIAPDLVKGTTGSNAVTGLIIDARGLGIDNAMCPQIVDESGKLIYGGTYIDPDWTVKYGTADYAPNDGLVSQALAGSSRAGNNPIVVKATGIKNTTAVISVNDGNLILTANQGSNFIKNTAVVILQ